MRLACPFCGDRDVSEFIYHGDGAVTRPDGSNEAAMHNYVYLRSNPAGEHTELWYHTAGCRRWLRARRDTRTHEFGLVAMARPAGLQKQDS